ncbi:AraC family transcriptional regulator [Flavobacteriaceae bacterium F89]|uniref:AraC family transcriptional regulator n=1 Tax=Cerina litoralis TaxID=2874477 RepID=A0AAE3EWV9_9FLAO|nr:AraC family transcriptional regulator [Cerina litoralis]MCG2462575.1 AraC family transcriptional regulator [Cerina litoralis]
MPPIKEKKRMQRISHMLLEMAAGNFFYRLDRSDKNDNVEALVIVLNMLAEEIQESFLHQGYVNSQGTTKQIVQMCFMLDEDAIIRMINQRASTILSTLYSNIIDRSFDSFLTNDSKNKWEKLWKTLNGKDFYDTSIELTFVTREKLLLPNQCYITTFKREKEVQRKTLVTVFHYSNGYRELEKNLKQSVVKFRNKHGQYFQGPSNQPIKQKLRLSYEDIRKIREGHNIIINNLDKELPSIKDFAHQLGTNEFKLKYGFKELYGTSVYRFLVQERLRKAKMLVQYSDMALKSIAHMTGFKSDPHFSRAFKKQYGFPPSELRKRSLKDDK